MKKIITIAIAFLALNSYSQNEIDALRYSQNDIMGTARYVSMGGAFSALGGNFSVTSTNPAGIALYRKTELTITPGFTRSLVSSDFYNSTTEDIKFNFNLNNIGLVSTYKFPNRLDKPGWKSISYAIGTNRISDFSNNITITGVNTSSSILEQFASNANGTYYTDLTEENGFMNEALIWQSYLINPSLNDTMLYEAPVSGNVGQTKTINTRGGMSETVISFGGNYDDKLYLGATVGMPRIRYVEESSFYEENLGTDTVHNYKHFTLEQYLRTKGTGINLKLGFIYKAAQWLRLGGAIHTPTFYQMSDEWNSSIVDANVENRIENHESSNATINYTVTTPLKAIGSIAFVFGDKGLISGEYEYINYSEARLSSDDYKYGIENRIIQQKYVATDNFKIGTEWRLDPITLRGGYVLQGNPFNSNLNNNTEQTSYCFGIGFKEEGYFVDFGYILTVHKEQYYLYDPVLVNVADNNYKNSMFLITLGFRW